MHEKIPVQKEFAQIDRLDVGGRGRVMRLQAKLFGTENIIGEVTLTRRDEPAPHYVATFLWVGPKHQGKGFGSPLLDEIERVSRESSLPVVLYEAIDLSQNPYAADVYEKRRGWIDFENMYDRGTRSFIYGTDDDVIRSQLIQSVRTRNKH